MSIRFKIKQSYKCKKCDGLGYYSISTDAKYQDLPVEYVCNDCDGSGEIWKDRSLPTSSLKTLLK